MIFCSNESQYMAGCVSRFLLPPDYACIYPAPLLRLLCEALFGAPTFYQAGFR